MIRIAQAASSETGTKYGKAPNQRRTGTTIANPGGNLDGELNVIPWKGGWEAVYRPKDPKVAEYIANFMMSAVTNGSHIGYSQDATRVGVFDACAKMKLPNPAMINTLVNCDCATLVGAAIYFAGIKLNTLRKLCTWEMNDVLLGSGKFTKLTDSKLLQSGTGIKRGDILWKTGHTAVSLDDDPQIPAGNQSNTQGGSNNMKFPEDPSKFLKENGLRTKDLDGNSWYVYSQTGTATYPLVNDMTYLVTFSNRSSVSAENDAAWIVAANRLGSHLYALKTSNSTKASVSGLNLTITRGAKYGRVTITRLS